MWRASSSISPVAMAAVALPKDGVPQTTTPCALAASRSIEALRMPVVIRSFRSGSASITARGKAVRSRIAQTMAKPCNAAMTSSGEPRCSLKTLISNVACDFRPVGHGECDVLIVVENGAAERHGPSFRNAAEAAIRNPSSLPERIAAMAALGCGDEAQVGGIYVRNKGPVTKRAP